MKILGLCGSLRKKSYNLAILREMERRLSAKADFTLFDSLGDIPPFQPDETSPHPSVLALRAEVLAANAILIASPEYVHGIPGVLKNALDWIVGTGEWDGKPTAIVNVTPSATAPQFVWNGLTEIIRVMSGGRVLDTASFMVTGAFKKFNAEGQIVDEDLAKTLDRSAAAILASE